MGFRDHLSFLFPRNNATETDSQKPQLGNDFGMHLLYDGTQLRPDQPLKEVEEDNQLCREPVE